MGACLAFFGPSLSVLLAYSPIGSPLLAFGPTVPSTVQSGILLLLLGLFLSAPMLGTLWALIAGRARPLGLSLAFSVSMIVGVFPGGNLSDAVQDIAYDLFASRSSDVVEAIAKYQSLNGVPPTELADLVPSLLPSLPGTGIPIAPVYAFGLSSGPCELGNAWHLIVSLRSDQTDIDRLFYCPNQDYDLESVEELFTYTSFEKKRDWVLSSTDLDD